MWFFSDVLVLASLVFTLPLVFVFAFLGFRALTSLRVRAVLQRKGYWWLTLGGTLWLRRELGQHAERLPPRVSVEMIPQYRNDVASLIDLGRYWTDREY